MVLVTEDMYAVRNKRELFEAALKFCDNGDYTFEYDEFPWVYARDEDGKYTTDFPAPMYPCVVLFREFPSRGLNHLPEVELLYVFSLLEIHSMFHALLSDGGKLGK